MRDLPSEESVRDAATLAVRIDGVAAVDVEGSFQWDDIELGGGDSPIKQVRITEQDDRQSAV